MGVLERRLALSSVWERLATGSLWVSRMGVMERRLALSSVWEGFAKMLLFGRFWGSIAVWDPYFRTKSIALFWTLPIEVGAILGARKHGGGLAGWAGLAWRISASGLILLLKAQGWPWVA